MPASSWHAPAGSSRSALWDSCRIGVHPAAVACVPVRRLQVENGETKLNSRRILTVSREHRRRRRGRTLTYADGLHVAQCRMQQCSRWFKQCQGRCAGVAFPSQLQCRCGAALRRLQAGHGAAHAGRGLQEAASYAGCGQLVLQGHCHSCCVNCTEESGRERETKKG